MNTHTRLIDLLNETSCRFRLNNHSAAGKSFEVAAARGTEVGQGAKALVCSAISSEGDRSLLLAVMPADQKLDYKRLALGLGMKKVKIAERSVAEDVTGCQIGAIPPFYFAPSLELVVDPELLIRYSEIAFNAGSLETSMVLSSEDYIRVAKPFLVKMIEQA
ncbi:Ala-tRNA(Pro) deacylase [Pseudomonas cedrina]|uniref:YbaK/aminoacyl-tRNA synthetase-associated domain-containing protein n=2 Tax=Pseudomonas cedrina TaxID=651740 RepID=A0A1V2K403_PSECE|nr:YbaK/EbsC family protein [Pseudomonas cedrina]ONH51591.1 hypothetical protein BLL36_21985 [Pseudomonas cedrina subsp. cedrina]SDT11472.1 Ala-tRNA(Pro) deacylase [Pseudomonas cedrina]